MPVEFQSKHGPNTLFQSVDYGWPGEAIPMYLVSLDLSFYKLIADLLTLKISGKVNQ